MKNTSPAAPLSGLLLVGGHSRRMGRDKAGIALGGTTLFRRNASLLAGLCTELRIACREDQVAGLAKEFTAQVDAYPETGPMGAILTALEAEPGTHWLVLPTDLARMDASSLLRLIDLWRADTSSEQPSQACLARSPERLRPEPLVGIWSPSALPDLRRALSAGQLALRELLPGMRIRELSFPAATLTNLNYPDDLAPFTSG